MPNPHVDYAWCTDKGQVRFANEDAVSVLPDLGLVVVADGIGGANAGEVASQLAADVIGERFRNRIAPCVDKNGAVALVKDAILEASKAIWESSQTSAQYSGMGTTAVVGYVGADWLVFAHVGDSRLYILRDAKLTRLTRDHSLIQESIDLGYFGTMEDARRSGINENIITRSLGTPNPPKVDSGHVGLRLDDLFLFCTDGLTGMVSDETMRRLLLAPGQKLDSLAGELVELANRCGGLDNITVALAQISARGEA